MPFSTCTKCLALIPIGASRCPRCLPPRRHKQTTTARGYGYQHQQMRKTLAPVVATGTIKCRRCHTLIRPGQPWDLGHDDHDRTRYTGPEHASCNRGRRKPTYQPPKTLTRH